MHGRPCVGPLRPRVFLLTGSAGPDQYFIIGKRLLLCIKQKGTQIEEAQPEKIIGAANRSSIESNLYR